MRILAAGGGSGGHVTPVAAVINEILKQEPTAEIMFVCDGAFEVQARGLMEKSVAKPVKVKRITAGKFRRYSHLTFLQHFTVPSLVRSNLLDVFKTGWGVLQSIGIIMTFRPDVLFAKGGYVCLPVGVAARLLRVPIVIHDSDTRPGLTNRVLSRWAAAIATGSPLENYRYPAAISRYVGVPISADFHPYTKKEQAAAKERLGFSPDRPLVVATGGGLGSVSINTAMIATAEALLTAGIAVYHVTGKAHSEEVERDAPADENYRVVPFVFEHMADVLGAADIVVSRASATFIQELAGLAKPVVLVPSRALGDQQKNAVAFAAAQAAVVLTDEQIAQRGTLASALIELTTHHDRAQKLAERLHEFARPHAARDVAEMIITTTRSR